MINIISKESLEKINQSALEILSFIKTNKIFITSKYSSDERIKGSTPLFRIIRAASGDDRFNEISSSSEETTAVFLDIIKNLANLLENTSYFQTHKLKDYSLDIKPKLCRELISKLEDMFIFGEITDVDIKDVYETLGKQIPKKFAQTQLDEIGQKIYSAIRIDIEQKAEDIKAKTITHYMDMVNRIDPDDSINKPLDFVNIGKKKISDMNSLRLCLSCKFENDKFRELVDQEFSNMVIFAASRIADKCPTNNDDIFVDVKNIFIGGKGFDISIDVNGKALSARAIPVEGSYVRFHYRYIIT